MSARPEPELSAAIIGGGITGLSAAYLLSRTSLKSAGRPLSVAILEASDRVGGKILTARRDGRISEAGPDSFVPTKPGILELVEELELGGELVGAEAANRRLYVYCGGRLREFPDVSRGGGRAVWAVMTSNLLSVGAKLRLAFEPFAASAPEGRDESLGSFIRRRLGPEALDRLVGPLLAGLHAADPDILSLQSAFPRLREIDKNGGIVRALLTLGRRKAGGGPPKPRASFLTFKNGLSTLPEALAARLPQGCVRARAPVASIGRREGAWELQTPQGLVRAKTVVAAIPASALSSLLKSLDQELAGALAEVPVETTATVSLAYPSGAFPRPLDAYGFLVVPKERGLVSAATYASSKFPGRCAPGETLIRCFLIGKKDRRLEALSAPELAAAAHEELKSILGLALPKPLFFDAHAWTVPQYALGHELRLARIASALKSHPGLFAAGCFYRGVGIPDCVEQGFEAARQTLEFLA